MHRSKRTDKSDLLAAYSHQWRFLEEFNLHDDHALATFLIQNAPYSDAGAVHHLTAIELQTCLNPMLYCHFLSTGVFEQFSGISRYQGESLFRWQADHTFVIEESFEFKRRIIVQDRIPAILRERKSRTMGNTHMAYLDFEFGRGACFGMVKIAITRDEVPNNAMHTDGNSAALHSRR